MEDTHSINKEIKETVDTRFSFAQFMQPFRNLRIKYLTLGTMDHYGKMEEQKKEREEVDRKGTWRSAKDQKDQVHQQFENIQSIKSSYSKDDLRQKRP